MTEQVAQPSAKQQETAEGQQVRIHDPDECDCEKPRSALIEGMATLTIVASKLSSGHQDTGR